MWVAIAATIVSFRRVIGDAALLLLLPYLAWVSLAAALTATIWRLNPAGGGEQVRVRAVASSGGSGWRVGDQRRATRAWRRNALATQQQTSIDRPLSLSL